MAPYVVYVTHRSPSLLTTRDWHVEWGDRTQAFQTQQEAFDFARDRAMEGRVPGQTAQILRKGPDEEWVTEWTYHSIL